MLLVHLLQSLTSNIIACHSSACTSNIKASPLAGLVAAMSASEATLFAFASRVALDVVAVGALASLAGVFVVAEGKASPRAGLSAVLVGPVVALVALSSSVLGGLVEVLSASEATLVVLVSWVALGVLAEVT